MNHKTELFETVPIPKAVLTFALPTILGMLITVAYILVDTFFVAQTGDPNQVAAITICMPVFMLCMALGNIFGVGGASYISRLLGAGEYETAKRTSAFAFYMSLALGVAASAIMLSVMDFLLPIIGTTPLTEPFSRRYLTWIAGGASMIVLSFGLGQIVRSVGAAKEAMIGMVAGTVLNIILDPIMILVFHMGVAGAAAATVISNAVSVLYFIRLIIVKDYPLSISPRRFKPNKMIVTSVLAIGVPSTLTELLMSGSQMAFNYFGAAQGENFLAAFGIANIIAMLPSMGVMGLSQGIQPLIGYTYAANLHRRLRGVLKFALMAATGSAAVLMGLVYLVGKSAVTAFINNADVIAQGQYIIYRFAWSIPILGVLFVLSTVFQSMGKAKQALVLSIARQGIVFLPIMLIFNFAFGKDGLILAQPVSDTISTLICVGLFLPVFKELAHSE
ncbi:MAG: MATE family efflux transporter [Oscillospiraceae bacterium]|jgi:putative MATE family efflux protein|nr:MATE family efflux transporter [Oscillospiraceae bacterium]